MAKQEFTNTSVILLLDGKTGDDNVFIKEWFEKSRFSTYEAVDVFQAFEELSDFTMRCRPDVILIEVGSLSKNFLVIQNTVQTLSGEIEFPLFALNDEGKSEIDSANCFAANLDELEIKLDRIFPKPSYAHAAA